MATLVCGNYVFRKISVLTFAKLQVIGLSNLSNLKSSSKYVPHLKFEQMLIRFTSFEELSMKGTEKVETN